MRLIGAEYARFLVSGTLRTLAIYALYLELLRLMDYQLAYFVAVLACLVCALALHAPGTTDVAIFEHWMRLLAEHGVRGTVARVNDNYPPLTFVLLEAARRLSLAVDVSLILGLKISLLVALYATFLLHWLWTRQLVTAVVLQLVLAVSGALGYLDIFWIPVALLALWSLQRSRYAWLRALFTVAVLIKPQPLVMIPFLALYVADARAGRAPGDHATW